MARVYEFSPNKGKVSPVHCHVPDDAMRVSGTGPGTGDLCAFRRGRRSKAGPQVCITTRRPRRVRIGYCTRLDDGWLLQFRNPHYPAESYREGELIVCGAVDGFFLRDTSAAASTDFRRPVVVASPFPEGPEVIAWQCDPSGIGWDGSDDLSRTLGGEPSDWAGGAWVNRIHPEDRAQVLALWTESLATGEPYAAAFRVLDTLSGGYRWLNVVARAIYDELGVISGWRGVFQPGELIDEQMTA
jgi:hypothetical protein